jgi:hypothetical protein
MPVGPLRTQVYVDELLSDVSVAYQNESYISDIIFPEVMVKHRTGIYFKYDKSKFRVENDLRAPGERSQRVHYGLSQATYGPLIEHSLEQDIPDEDREEAVQPLNLDQDATENITERLLLSKEKNANTILTTAGTGYSNDSDGLTTLSGTSQWSDYANSNPISDVRNAMDRVKKKIMKKPNTLVLGYEVFSKLQDHPQILERIKYSQFGVVTPEILARVFNIERIIIAEAEENTANETATDSMAYVWGKNAWIMYITAKPGIRQVSYGYTLRKGPRKTLRWREEAIETDFVKVKDVYEHKVVAIEAAHRIATAIA